MPGKKSKEKKQGKCKEKKQGKMLEKNIEENDVRKKK
jgi:hypothetical protein